MQKVEGSNPFSRSQKGTHLQAFFACAVGLCVCVGSDWLRTRRWPIVGRSKKNGLFAGRFWFVRTEVLLRACRRSSVPPAAGVGRLFLQTARSCTRAPARARPAIPIPRGESDFSPDTVRPTLCPAQRPRRAMAPTAATSQQTASEGSGEAPVTGGWAVAIARGSSPRLSLPSEAGVCSQPGWAPAHRPERASTLLGQRRADQRESSGAPNARSATRRTASCVLLLSPRRCR
jgi:hypothetical protein